MIGLCRWLLIFCSFAALAQEPPAQIVLVSGPASTVSPLGSLELRKLFLGVPVSQGNVELEPFLYRNDKAIDEVFLKGIVGMTLRSYDRKVLQLRLSSGHSLMQKIDSPDQAPEILFADPMAVTYMWRDDADRLNLRTVQVLWQELE